MGAVTRGRQAERIGDKLPTELVRHNIIHIILESYEDGDGTLTGVLKATPKSILEAFGAFLEKMKIDQEEQWRRFRDAEQADELELIDDLLDQIDDELWISSYDDQGKRIDPRAGQPRPARHRLIDE